MDGLLSFFISLPHAAGADPVRPAALVLAPHKITPHVKCKAYQGQNAMRWQAKSVRRNMGNFSLRLQVYRDARAKGEAANVDKRRRLPCAT
jgi:hypothetical protein